MSCYYEKPQELFADEFIPVAPTGFSWLCKAPVLKHIKTRLRLEGRDVGRNQLSDV